MVIDLDLDGSTKILDTPSKIFHENTEYNVFQYFI